MLENNPYKYWFAGIIGVSATQKILLTQEVTEQQIFEMNEIEVMQLCQYHGVEPNLILEAKRQNLPEKIMENSTKKQISLVTFHDKEYPRKLRYINQPPYALYYKGQLLTDQVTVAIVGARKCSEYGRCMAEELGELLAKNNVPVVSGLAYGIDSAGHAGVLRGNGKTYSVLGCGVDICYPASSMNIYGNIIETGGGILSEYAPGTQPITKFFPARNRIISGLSDIVVVIEARLRSGSLITADMAMEQGKDVYALPGRITDANSQGTNRLIYQGAAILNDLEQFLLDTNLKKEDSTPLKKEIKFLLEKEETLLYSVLDFEPKYLDSIIEETGLPVGQVLAVIDSLKHKKIVKESYKNYFSKTL